MANTKVTKILPLSILLTVSSIFTSLVVHADTVSPSTTSISPTTSDALLHTYTDEFTIEFPVNGFTIDRKFKNNAQTLGSLTSLIRNISTDARVTDKKVEISTQASPEGGFKRNMELVTKRKISLVKFLTDSCAVASDNIVSLPTVSSMEATYNMVYASNSIYSGAILEVLRGYSAASEAEQAKMLEKLRTIEDGKAWDFLSSQVFPKLRNGRIYVKVTWQSLPVVDFDYRSTQCALPYLKPAASSLPASTPSHLLSNQHILSLSSNVLGLAAAVVNLTADYRFAPAWSVALTGAVSNWDYFKTTCKYRVCMVRPEIRWWPARRADGFYMGAHYQTQLFNLTWGDRRWQNRSHHDPTQGGGLTFGYRFPFLSYSNWKMEVSAGVGAYDVKYDEFQNRPNGLKIGEGRRLYVGPDELAFSIVYQIPYRR